MLVIPAIDIQNGQCVRLFQGDFDKRTVYSSDPKKVAKKWVKQGAKLLHVIDLDGAKSEQITNQKIIEKIAKAVNVPIQVGGGIRNKKTIEDLLSSGVSRIIIGSLALENSQLTQEIMEEYPERIIVALDVKKGLVVKRGWQKTTSQDIFKTARKLVKLGAKNFLFTDVLRDGTLTSPNFKTAKTFKQKIQASLLVAGGVSEVKDVQKLKKIGVDGVVIGKALYEGKIDFQEALKC